MSKWKKEDVQAAMPTPMQTYDADGERATNIVGRQIVEARHRTGMSLKEFSKYMKQFGMDVSVGAISKWELGKSVPNAYQIIAISYALGISDPLHYFTENHRPKLNDEGIQKVAAYIDDLIASGKYAPEVLAGNIIEFVDMPVSDLRVSAGMGAFLDEGSFENIRFPKSAVPAKAKFGVRVSGDSMEPVYHDGQIVWVEPCASLRVNEVGIFIYDGEGYIKAYGEQEPGAEIQEQYIGSDNVLHSQPVLLSYNQKYAPKAVLPDLEFEIVGRVL